MLEYNLHIFIEARSELRLVHTLHHQPLDHLLRGLVLTNLLQRGHLLDAFVAVELRHADGPEDDLEEDEGDDEDDLALLVDPPRLLHLVHGSPALGEEAVPQLVILLVLPSLHPAQLPNAVHRPGKVRSLSLSS